MKRRAKTKQKGRAVRSALDEVRAFRARVDQVKADLRAEREGLLARVGEIDAALVELGDPPRVEKQARARRASVEPPAGAAARAPGSEPGTGAPAAPVERKPGVRGPAGEVPRLLQELRPFWDAALSPRQREVVGLRASGKMPAEIADQLKIERSAVANLLFRSTKTLQAARERATKSEAAEHAASDGEEGEPDPAPPASDEDEKEEVAPRAGVGRGRGVRHCRRCGQAGHNTAGCDLTDEDLAAARLQDIAAACVRLGLSPVPPLPAPIPVRADLPAPAATLPTWDREDLDAIAEMAPPAPEPVPAPPPVVPIAPAAPVQTVDPPDEVDQMLASRETALDRARRRLQVIGGRPRARSVGGAYNRHLTRDERALGEVLVVDVERPIMRGDCEEDPGRPCPWVGCSMNNYLDVNPETGSIKFNFPHLEPWEVKPEHSCSLDVAERGGITLEETGEAINLTRERVRQVEVGALEKIKRASEEDGDALDMMPVREASPLGAAVG